MRINLINVFAAAALALATFTNLHAADSSSDAERIARLEARLLELESRLADTEQETKEVKVLASSVAASGGSDSSILGNKATFDILAGSAWRNLRWTQEEQWEGVKRGVTEEKVIELLGYPPRSVDSLKPRIDKVYWYETSLRDSSTGMRGKISFKKGRVVSVEKPNFNIKPAAATPGSQSEAARQRLP
ncbi:MAG TPA: hypothetical protein DCX06_12475 [Opitutae bacterium]|nr:hypothetical protein [Opitutae bacterium]